MASDYEAITKENTGALGWKTASRKTQICMYSDPTHFIYEILQNADDYKATEVRFRLSKDELLIEHDGGPFVEENVKAITDFGESTSSDDLLKTGRFGVGFKSAFAFTATPTVISGDEHFQIYGLYRVREHPYPSGFSRSRTRIILPFNHESEKPDYVDNLMSKEDAFLKISARLTDLNMKTLLFTQNIREIRWEIDGDCAGCYLREDKIDGKSRWTTINDGKQSNTYLVFSSIPKWQNKAYKAIEIAFSVDEKKQISSIDDFLYVLFPTTQETHLKFIINGPFQTTPSRETISEEIDFNKHLMEEISELMKDVLLRLRDMNLLTAQFLSVLPNGDDNLKDFYKPLLDAIVKTFRNHELIPTKDGNHSACFRAASLDDICDLKPNTKEALRMLKGDGEDKVYSYEEVAKHFNVTVDLVRKREKEINEKIAKLSPISLIVRGSKNISDVLTDEDVTYLITEPENTPYPCPKNIACLSNFTKKKWVVGVKHHGRADKFLDSLDIPVWSNKDFLDRIRNKFIDVLEAEEIDTDTKDWLTQKSDEWLRAFYLLLYSVAKKEEKEDELPNLVIICTESNDLKEGRSVYFPPEDTAPSLNLPTVKKALFDGLKEEQKDRLIDFFERAGVQEIGEKQEIETILKDYYSKCDNQLSEEQHKRHIEKFIKYFQKDQAEGLFKNYYIFRYGSNLEYHQARNCFLDSPFTETGLSALYRLYKPAKVALWTGYQNIDEFEDFAIAVGVQNALVIEESNTSENPKQKELQHYEDKVRQNKKTKIDEDFTINGIERILEINVVEVAKLVWRTMYMSKENSQKAKYQPNKQADQHNAPSQLIHHLKSHLWIPNQQGDFCYPADVSQNDLLDDFKYDDHNGWLTAIGFGENKQKETEEYKSKQKAAEELGITPEDAKLIKKIKEDPEKYADVQKLSEKSNGSSGSSDNKPKNLGKSKHKNSDINYRDGLVKAVNRPGETKIQDQVTDEGKVKNPEHRRKKVNEGHTDRSHSEPPPDKRRKNTNHALLEEPDEQVREYLTRWYAGKCQICDKTFPKRNGQPFFVANYIVQREHARFVDNQANALCLCAEHFAQWENGAVEAKDIPGQISAFKTEIEGGNTSPILRIKLCGRDCEIKYIEKHLLDLQELLRASDNHDE